MHWERSLKWLYIDDFIYQIWRQEQTENCVQIFHIYRETIAYHE